MWCLFFVRFTTVAILNSGPREPDSQYRHPHHVKGTVRYTTGTQEAVYQVAVPAMYGSGIVALLLSILNGLAYRRRVGK
jgi:hypothetical protein